LCLALSVKAPGRRWSGAAQGAILPASNNDATGIEIPGLLARKRGSGASGWLDATLRQRRLEKPALPPAVSKRPDGESCCSKE